MTEVKLELLDTTNGVTGVLDVWSHQDFPLTLNFLISDIKNIAERSGAYSKTFLIPASQENNLIMEMVFDTNVHNTSKWYEEKPCRVMVNGIPIFRGNMRLQNVITRRTHREYEIVLFGDNMAWVKELEEVYLNTLDFNTPANPTGLVTWDKAGVEATWLASILSYDYYFPVINYGAWNEPHPTWDSSSSSMTNTLGVTVEDVFPALYVKTILERGFASIGWEISSSFMDTVDFEKLVYPFVNETFQRSDDYVTTNKVIVKRGASLNPLYNLLYSGASGVRVNFDVFEFDTFNQWSGTNNFTPDSSGMYKWSMNFKINYGWIIGNYPNWKFSLEVWNDTDNISMYKETSGNLWNSLSFDSPYLYFQTGKDYILLYTTTSNQVPSVTFPISSTVNGQQINRLTITPDTQLVKGSSFKIKDVLNPNTTVYEILRGVIHAFNLYIKTDVQLKTIYFEPRPDFYQNTTEAIDWTEKIDTNSEYKLSFLRDLSREYCLKFMEDSSDGHLEERNRLKQNIAGEYCHTFSDRFPKGKEDNENPHFAYTYHILDVRVNPWLTNTVPRPFNKLNAPLMARMWTEFRGDTNPPDKSTDFMPRLLYKSHANQTNPDGDLIIWRWEGDSLSMFPAALSEGFAELPTAMPLTYGQSTGSSRDGLFKEYYEDEFAAIEKGTLLQISLNLDIFDISSLDFSKYIFINAPSDLRGYWILNKIVDFNPMTPSLTRVELFKFSEYIAEPLNDIYAMTIGTEDSNFGDLTNPRGDAGLTTWFSKGEAGQTAKVGDKSYMKPSLVWDSGTGSSAFKGQNSSVIGIGLKSKTREQQILGRYNQEADGAQWIVGAGAADGARENALKLDESGSFQIYGGELWTEDSGELLMVVTEIDGSYSKVYINNE